MPQYFFVEQSIGTRYFTSTGDQSAADPYTPTSETGKWTSTRTGTGGAEDYSFNTGETGAREQLDVKLNFIGVFTANTNATVQKVDYQISLMGCDTVDGTYVSQGATYVKTVTAASGGVTGDSPVALDNGGSTMATNTYNFMLKKKFWHLKVSMKVSAFIQLGTENNTTIYGFVAIHDDGISRKQYKTKTFMHGHGLQVMSGPKSYVRFGRNQNLIVGDFSVEGDTEGGGSGYFSNFLTIGKNETIQSHPLFVEGDIAATGNVIAYVSSDERLKTNISPLEESLEKVKRLNPVDFAWKDTTKGWGTATPADIGLIAQEVEKDFPSLVGEMGDGYKGIRYDRMVPILVDCIKTQDKKIDKLEGLVEKLINKPEEE
jgi:hypothetical protein|tara:strand:+ start:489 stop:1610 length:1122 start_codon:yes stop_codon:yes gene_type:complete